MQVLLGVMLIDALHAAFEDRVVALDRVRVDVATGPLKGRVLDRAVINKFLADGDVLRASSLIKRLSRRMLVLIIGTT